jgi:phosphoglycolate phosphatase
MPATNGDVVLFDLDGVLADSRAPIAGCINHALAEHGYAPRPPAELHASIGALLPSVFAEIIAAPADSPAVAACVASYRTRYATASLTETTATPGIGEALARLAAAGRRLGVATSKPRPFAEPLLEALGLRRFFAVVSGPELDMGAEDKTATVGAALRALGADRGAMVGDRSFDMIAARAHGLRAVGVGWGIGSREELVAAGADTIVATPAGLADAIGADGAGSA